MSLLQSAAVQTQSAERASGSHCQVATVAAWSTGGRRLRRFMTAALSVQSSSTGRPDAIDGQTALEASTLRLGGVIGRRRASGCERRRCGGAGGKER